MKGKKRIGEAKPAPDADPGPGASAVAEAPAASANADLFGSAAELTADLHFLEELRRGRKEFTERACRESQNQDEQVLAVLRLEPAYQFAEFFYLLRAYEIRTEEDLRRLAEIHNQYIVGLSKDAEKMARLGLKLDRLLDAIFTADTMPRLLQNWRERPGAIDQSNLARLLVAVMSSETCRKLVVACAEAGFVARERTPYGTILVSSNGIIERIFGSCVREMRLSLQQGR